LVTQTNDSTTRLGEAVSLDKVTAGDLVFVTGLVNYYHDNASDGVGHVGIATGQETIIHAANKKTNLEEIPLDKFVEKTEFRGARRYIPKNVRVLTFETPSNREVEIADDIRWIILQSLPK